jgi:ligand-binding sensor domain-containing protein/serine phosphatase RsbU (regulator of sigma subunit)
LQTLTLNTNNTALRAFLFLVFFSYAYCLFAIEKQGFSFRKISIENGLSQSSVNCIIQDKEGYVWLGTQDGLNKYDGLSCKVLNYNPDDKNSLSNPHIRSLFECSDNIIWVGTESGGLNAYNKLTGKFTAYSYDKNNETSISHNNVRYIAEDTDKNIWIATFGGGLNKLNKNTGEFKRISGKTKEGIDVSELRIETILLDGNIVWIGTNDKGLFTYNTIQNVWNQVNIPLLASNEIRVSAISNYDKHFIWIGTYGQGLFLLNKQNGTIEKHYTENSSPVKLSSNYVVKILPETKDKIWIGTYGGGLCVLDLKNNQTSIFRHNSEDANSLSNNDVWSIIITKENTVFIGTDGGGVNIFDIHSQKFPSYKTAINNSSLTNNIVRCIYEDSKGNLWIGTYGGGLNFYNQKTGESKLYKHKPEDKNSISNNRIVSIAETPDGYLWFGTDGAGLNRFDYATQKFTNFQHQESDVHSLSNNVLWCILPDADSGIWIGTRGGGLNYFNTQTKKCTHYRYNANDENSLKSDFIRCLYDDKKGNIWIGTEGGGFSVFNKKTKTINNYKNNLSTENGLNNNTVRTIYIQDGNYVWLGTDGGGLNLFDIAAKKFYHFTDRDGLPNNVIYGILPDKKGYLWISTNNGLFKFKLIENLSDKKFFLKKYYTSDGLQSNEFNTGAYFINPKGEMFFGGINGYNRFLPDNITENKFIPPVKIARFKVFESDYYLDTLVEFKKLITLNYQQNFFSFSFSALSYSMPEKNKYAYMLEGFDKEWIYTENRNYAGYTNLDPGIYLFKVKASNNDGVWNEDGAVLTIIIKPPFYKTWWFYLSLSLLTIVSIVLFIKIRENNLKREKHKLEETVALRTEQIQQKNIELSRQKKEITDSINYAKRIQQAILPLKSELKQHLKQAAILYLPKDIVSGDFYWFKQIDEHTCIYAVGDCTGHGVPGALMSMIGIDKLNEIVNHTTQPAEIIIRLNNAIKTSLRQSELDNFENGLSFNDGMDIAICKLNSATLSIEYAGANRPLWIFRKGEISSLLEIVKADKYAVGGMTNYNQQFTNHQIKLNINDTVYIFTDGYADQFGGTSHKVSKKFLTKNLKKLLESIQKKTMDKQEEDLLHSFYAWKGDYEQTDDVLVIGVRV